MAGLGGALGGRGTAPEADGAADNVVLHSGPIVPQLSVASPAVNAKDGREDAKLKPACQKAEVLWVGVLVGGPKEPSDVLLG